MTRDKKWADLGRLLGYTGIPGLATQMRNSYSRVILPYEQFCERVRNSPALSPNKQQRDASLKTHVNIQTSGLGRASTPDSAGEDDSPPSSPLSSTSSPLSEPPDEADLKEMNGVKSESSRPRRSTRHNEQEQGARKSGCRQVAVRSPLRCVAGTRRTSTANENGVAGAEAGPSKEPRQPSEVSCSTLRPVVERSHGRDPRHTAALRDMSEEGPGREDAHLRRM